MIREYSAKSIAMKRFLACFGALSSTIKYESVKFDKKYCEMESDLKPIDILTEMSENDFPLRIEFIYDSEPIKIEFTIVWSILSVEIKGVANSEQEETLHQLIKDSLQLADLTDDDIREVASLPNINGLLWRIYDIVKELPKQFELSKEKPVEKLRCFVSFRFDDHSKALAFELREFLELIGVDFLSGLGFEPRSISAKVLERIDGNLNLFIVIQSISGDSAWLNQEIGVAKGKGLPILVLKEQGTEADMGILADTEYIEFDKNYISKAFVGVLQALRFLKREK